MHMNPLRQAAKCLVCASVAIAAAAPAHSQQKTVPRLTGGQLIEYFQGQPGVPVFEQKPEWLLKMRLADGYISGVADLAEGVDWCDKGQVKSIEINAMVVADLRKLNAGDLSLPASKLVTKSLGRHFPCKP
jgi:hypothetical protein